MSYKDSRADERKDSSVVVHDAGALTVENTVVTANGEGERIAAGSGEKRSGKQLHSTDTRGDPAAAVQEEEACASRLEQPASNTLKLAMIAEQMSDAGQDSRPQSPSKEGKSQPRLDKASISTPESKKNVALTSKEGEPQPTRCSSLSSWQWSIPAVILCPLLGCIALWFSVKSHKHLTEGELYEARWSGKIARFAAVTTLAIDGILLAFIIAIIVGVTQ